jgi:hypothetical protein
MKNQTQSTALAQGAGSVAEMVEEINPFFIPSTIDETTSPIKVIVYQDDTRIEFNNLPAGIESQNAGKFFGTLLNVVHQQAKFMHEMGGRMFNCKLPVHIRVELGENVYDSYRAIRPEFHKRLRFGYSPKVFKRFASRHFRVFTNACTNSRVQVITLSEFLKRLTDNQLTIN